MKKSINHQQVSWARGGWGGRGEERVWFAGVKRRSKWRHPGREISGSGGNELSQGTELLLVRPGWGHRG